MPCIIVMTGMDTNELHIKAEYSDSGSKLHLNGALTIQHARRIREALMAAINRQVPLLITGDHTSRLDLAVLQLFIAAGKTAAQCGTTITFDLHIPASVQAILQHAGMDENVLPAS